MFVLSVCPSSNQKGGENVNSYTFFFFFDAEWTQISTRYLREQLAKISDFYHMASNTGDGPVPVPPDVEQAMKQWEYNEKLAFHMFQVTFLRHSGLCSVLSRKEQIPYSFDFWRLKCSLM